MCPSCLWAKALWKIYVAACSSVMWDAAALGPTFERPTAARRPNDAPLRPETFSEEYSVPAAETNLDIYHLIRRK